jgi:phosphoribosylanthranilate isomerase
MTKIKICGLTRMRDIEIVNELMPDYAGFVFAKSRRRLAPAQAAVLCAAIAPGIQKVGVFVDEDAATMLKIKELCGLDILQLHGGRKYSSLEGCHIWRALRVEDEHSFYDMDTQGAEALLLDSFVPGVPGGTGAAFDWDLIGNRVFDLPVVLAGGLKPSNVREAICRVRPFAVDVSSGVETDGNKDYMKIKQLIEEVKKDEIG